MHVHVRVTVSLHFFTYANCTHCTKYFVNIEREREKKTKLAPSACNFLSEHDILMGTTPKELQHDKYPSKSWLIDTKSF